MIVTVIWLNKVELIHMKEKCTILKNDTMYSNSSPNHNPRSLSEVNPKSDLNLTDKNFGDPAK